LAAIMLGGCLKSIPTEKLPDQVYPEKRSSSSITITSNGELLLVVNPDSNSLTFVDPITQEVIREIKVGLDPRTVSVDVDGHFAAVANRAGNSLSIIDVNLKMEINEIHVGVLPWGVGLSQDGRFAYVACEGDNWVAVLDIKKMEVSHRILVEERPNGLALSRDGNTLYVTHLLSAEISVIDLVTGNVVAVIPTWVDGNLAQSIVLHPLDNKAYLPLTRSNTSNTRLSFDATVFPLVTVVDLNDNKLLPKEIISLPEADQPVGLPYDAVFSPEGDRLYVVNAASNDLSVIDMVSGLGMNHLLVGDNPRGVVTSPDGQWLFVNNTLSGSITVIDTRHDFQMKELVVTEIPLAPILLDGKKLFHSSRHPELSRDGWISCNTCHWEGEHDGRTWVFDFAGPRNTTSLLGMINTYPLRWSAEWDESADSEFSIIKEQFGSGLLDEEMHATLGEANSGRSPALDSLATFIDSLAYLPNYHADDLDVNQVREGRRIFNDPEVGCAKCHSGPFYTDYQTHNVGTAYDKEEKMGLLIDTPTLLSLRRSAPYLHEGSAATLYDVLTITNPDDIHGVTSQLEEEELNYLIVYMLSLP